MKPLFLAIATLVMSTVSHALVADKFRCAMEVKDLETNVSTKEQKDFFIARLPVLNNPAQDFVMTASQITDSLTLTTSKAELGAFLNFYYKHAVKFNSEGLPVEARQLTCIGLTGDYCKKASGNGVIHSCISSAVACMEPHNPFDPDNGWSPTTLIDGVPMFNEKAFSYATANITDDDGKEVGTVSLKCQFLGSFQ